MKCIEKGMTYCAFSIRLHEEVAGAVVEHRRNLLALYLDDLHAAGAQLVEGRRLPVGIDQFLILLVSEFICFILFFGATAITEGIGRFSEWLAEL